MFARYLNALGALGWYVNGRWLKRSAISAKQARLLNLLIPYLRFETRLNLNSGLSLLAVWENSAPWGDNVDNT